MPASFFKKPKKTTCSECGNPLEQELIGRQSRCRTCMASYMREYRLKLKYKIREALAFYQQNFRGE